MKRPERRMKTLIVEDDFTARKLMQNYILELGETDIAVNGREAVEVFEKALHKKDKYDLICMDIMMPEMDGVEALREIRKIEEAHQIFGLSGVKVLMTTAKNQSQDIFGAFREGCEGYLTKPFTKDDLLTEIGKLGLFESQSAN
jgi:two-component system chemotaxis response regulator CheY